MAAKAPPGVAAKAPAAAAAAAALPAGTTLLRAVAGTPEAVVERLRAQGVAAGVEDGVVVVRGADGARARKALAALPEGPVRVSAR